MDNAGGINGVKFHGKTKPFWMDSKIKEKDIKSEVIFDDKVEDNSSDDKKLFIISLHI